MPQRDIPTSVNDQLADLYEHIRRIERQLAAQATIELPGGVGNLTALYGDTTWDPASVADDAMDWVNVAVVGAEVGDFAIASFTALDAALPSAHWAFEPSITTPDFVHVVLRNRTGSTVDLPSGTVRALVFHFEP